MSRRWSARLIIAFIAASGLADATALAQEAGASPPAVFDVERPPLFLGYESEPGMDYGGRSVASLQAAASRAFASIGRVGERRPGVAPAWEVPLAVLFMLVQHEVGGHGGRARELSLGPSYGLGVDISAYTTIRRPPRSNLEGSLLAVGGVEADAVLADRVLRELLSPAGAEGSKVPLLVLAKLDLSVYVVGTTGPRRQGFVEQYREGNDIAYWLVSRQAARLGLAAGDVWEGGVEPELGDRLLDRNLRAARVAAIWNLLDPSLVGAVWAYARDHVGAGRAVVHLPVWRVSPRLALAVGTRAALGPRDVSRALDVHAAFDWGALSVYVRDLDSSLDRTWGFGARLHEVAVLDRLSIGFSADRWDEPRAAESAARRGLWNATLELEGRLAGRFGLVAKIGRKSPGFLPGRPLGDGSYLGFGVTTAL